LLALLSGGCANMAARRQFEALSLLPPAAFGAEAERMQRLTVTRDSGGPQLILDAAVEIDATELRVAGFLLGQRVLLLAWNGARLVESRESMVPSTVKGRAILRDLQLAYWPAPAVRSILPRGCVLNEQSRHRQIECGGAAVLNVEREDDLPLGSARLNNLARHYRITIEAAQ
jgi:hypothetical protein